ncbi:hypothetical protein PT974_00336 [Cladobotryum mycophilum]|uniref:Tetraspanin Tsp3 n=1 Tax=Cladobotryum mycophilum TaxID=491253 RepID=A0ABR0T0T2_9HYPO
MVINFGLIFLLASSLLFAIAAVVYFHSSSLSLPIGSATTILTALLPIGSLINAFIYPSVLQAAHSSTNRLQQLSPTLLQALQAIFTTILATLLSQDIVPSPTVECLIDNGWSSMFKAHDGESIRRIQDTLKCCGLRTVQDKFYPFITKTSNITCVEAYGYTQACRGPWKSALKSSAGVDFGVVIAVSLMQIFGLFMMGESPNWWTSWRATGRRQRVTQHESRPLLTAAEDEEEVVERQESAPRGYQALNDSEEPGPRLEPSAIGHERNAWNES